MRRLEKKNRLVLFISTIASLALVWGYGWLYLKLPIRLVLFPTTGLLLFAGLAFIMDKFAERMSLKRERAALGKCAQCGYDLRASKQRCPECGAPIPPQKAPPAHA